MIDKTIQNIKKYFNTWKGILTAKIYIYKKKILYKVLEGILTAKISTKKLYKVLKGILTVKIANIKKNIFFVFPMYKRARYKNG